jgi:hypothetical protein
MSVQRAYRDYERHHSLRDVKKISGVKSVDEKSGTPA